MNPPLSERASRGRVRSRSKSVSGWAGRSVQQPRNRGPFPGGVVGQVNAGHHPSRTHSFCIRLTALIDDVRVIRRILGHLGFPTEMPAAQASRAPPLERFHGHVGDDISVP